MHRWETSSKSSVCLRSKYLFCFAYPSWNGPTEFQRNVFGVLMKWIQVSSMSVSLPRYVLLHFSSVSYGCLPMCPIFFFWITCHLLAHSMSALYLTELGIISKESNVPTWDGASLVLSLSQGGRLTAWEGPCSALYAADATNPRLFPQPAICRLGFTSKL